MKSTGQQRPYAPLNSDEARLANLLAQGWDGDRIARELGLPRAEYERRLAVLQQRLDGQKPG